MTTFDVLVAARAEVAKGWCKDALVDSHNNVCAVGAVCVASGMQRSYLAMGGGGSEERRQVIYRLLGAVLPEDYVDIVPFNNASTTTKADVLALFDRAIAAEAVTATSDPSHVYTLA